jgi:hypothetical protein
MENRGRYPLSVHGKRVRVRGGAKFGDVGAAPHLRAGIFSP